MWNSIRFAWNLVGRWGSPCHWKSDLGFQTRARRAGTRLHRSSLGGCGAGAGSGPFALGRPAWCGRGRGRGRRNAVCSARHGFCEGPPAGRRGSTLDVRARQGHAMEGVRIGLRGRSQPSPGSARATSVASVKALPPAPPHPPSPAKCPLSMHTARLPAEPGVYTRCRVSASWPRRGRGGVQPPSRPS